MPKITLEGGERDAWVCGCGNTPGGDGFLECDGEGNETEPVDGWPGLYLCNRCGAVVDQDDLEIVGEVAYRIGGRLDEAGGGVAELAERVFLKARAPESASGE